MTATVHVPVLAETILQLMQPRAGQTLVDGTLGGGGHTRLFAQAVSPDGRVIAVDRDPLVISRTVPTLSDLPVVAQSASYDELPEVLQSLGIDQVDGILLDLGLSSDQLADHERGFSFNATGDLDLRFNSQAGEPAWQWLKHVPEQELADVIYQYGEERLSRRIARKIVEVRQQRPLRSAQEIAELVRRCVPRSKNHRIDPATRTFQALRIAVNDELVILQRALQRLPEILRPGGMLAVISFHSLEDRMVKQAFKGDERLELVTRKPIVPSDAEIRSNSRARSAKLRIAAKITA